MALRGFSSELFKYKESHIKREMFFLKSVKKNYIYTVYIKIQQKIIGRSRNQAPTKLDFSVFMQV